MNQISLLKVSLADITNAFKSGFDSGGFINGLKSIGNAISNSITPMDIDNIKAC